MRTTNWCVITGAPCSGKTTVITRLEQRGYAVVHEAARAHIDAELQKGRRIDQIKADILAFESHILYRKIEIEASLPADKLIFLDRAVPDSIGYYLLEGLDPADPIQKSRLIRYHKIFFFERLSFEQDPVRSENDQIADRLHGLLLESYQMLHYELIHVPMLTLNQRVDFILARL